MSSLLIIKNKIKAGMPTPLPTLPLGFVKANYSIRVWTCLVLGISKKNKVSQNALGSKAISK